MGARAWIVPALAVGLLALAAPPAAAQRPPSRVQAAAAVDEFKRVRAACGAGPECETRAKRRFVELMSCVVHGTPAVNAATLAQDFTGYVDLVSQALDARDAGAAGAPGPCFAAAGAPATAPAAARPAPAAKPGSEGPTAEALRRFRKQAEEQSQPVAPTTVGETGSEHDKLKADLEAMRGRLQGGAATGSTGPSGATLAPPPAPVAPAAPPPPPAPAAATGAAAIQGGPASAAGAATIQGGPISSPAVIPYPPGAKVPPPTSTLRNIPVQSPPPSVIPYPAGVQPPSRQLLPAGPPGYVPPSSAVPGTGKP